MTLLVVRGDPVDDAGMRRILLTTVVLVLATQAALGIEVCGSGIRVDCVVDGDTLWWRGEKIRILAMDAPEISQARCPAELELGLRARQALVDLVSQGNVRIERNGKDQYGRTLATVIAGDQDAAETLIAAGLARVYVDRRYGWCGH